MGNLTNLKQPTSPPREPHQSPDPHSYQSATMSLGSQIYATLFKKNYAMLATVFGAGFAFELGFNQGMNKLWDWNNRGRQWKDIRHKFIEAAEEEEEWRRRSRN